MKLVKERSITVVFDAVSISKDIEILGGPLTQNFYSESGTYIPNRFITPTVLTPKVYIVDPNNIIPSGDKHEELLECIWYEDGNKIITNDEYKLNKDNTLTVLKNSEKDFTISYSAKWLDPRKKQTITIEDSVQFVTIALGDGNIKPRLTLDKAQNWIHNPLKNERIYSIKAYVSKDKLYEGAVEWYCTLKGTEKKLIDNSFLFYEGGQYSNELKVNSAYMPDCIITAKNISDSKLKEIYWFFDKHGNPLTYATPDKTIIEGSNVFSLPESPITSKLDYKIEGLTMEQLVKNGDFKDELKYWNYINNVTASINKNGFVEIIPKTSYGSLEQTVIGNKNDLFYFKFDLDSMETLPEAPEDYVNSYSIGFNNKINGIIKDLKYSNILTKITSTPILCGLSVAKSIYTKFVLKSIIVVNLTQTFGAGNEPTKEWCDEHITGYFEGVKSVQTPMRVKSVGENLLYNGNGEFGLNGWVALYNATEIKNLEGGGFSYKRTSEGKADGIRTLVYLTKGSYWIRAKSIGQTSYASQYYSLINFSKTGERKVILEIPYDKNKVEVAEFTVDEGGLYWLRNENLGAKNSIQEFGEVSITKNKPSAYINSLKPSLYYINNQLELKSVGSTKDYIEDGKLYKYISDNGEILEQPEIINLSTQGSLTTYPNGTIVIEPAILVEKHYNDGIKVDLPVKSLTSIKVGADYLDTSKAVVKDNLITHPELENGVFVTVEYIYDDSPIYGINSIGYLSLEEILDAYWLENVYTYKVTNGEWELVKVTDIEDYEEWLKTEKTSPYTLAPDGIIFGKYEANTKFLRQFPSSLYVDFIAPDRLKEGVTQIKARALVGTKDGVIDKPSRYFKITWLKRALRPGQQDIVIGTGDEILVDVGEKDAITIEIEDLGILKSLVNEQGEYLIEENNKILVGR